MTEEDHGGSPAENAQGKPEGATTAKALAEKRARDLTGEAAGHSEDAAAGTETDRASLNPVFPQHCPYCGACPGQPHGRTRGVRKVDQWLWLWPVAILAVIAVSGQVWGPYGGLVAGVLSIVLVTLLVGGDLLSQKVRLTVVLAGATVFMAATVGHTWGIQKLGTHPLPPKTATETPAPTTQPTPTTPSTAPNTSTSSTETPTSQVTPPPTTTTQPQPPG